MPNVLITGSSRGIGLELVRQYAADGWDVQAMARAPDKAVALQEAARQNAHIRIHALDVTDFAAVDRLAIELRGQPIDVLINCAGVFGGGAFIPDAPQPHQDFGDLDYAAWRQVLEVNTLAPTKMIEAFTDHIAASDQKKIVMITSFMGSIGALMEEDGGFYPYRTSKAALNMVARLLSMSLRKHGMTVLTLHPGWVQTDMGGPSATVPVPESAKGLRRVIDMATPQQSGSFLTYQGETLPW
ncbi:MAG: SDR family oxidoreductase [Alphaproteobacteria bacterium]|nr:MAG: SDR family oxidoreductase [Alphaproteobacteria bacterium]